MPMTGIVLPPRRMEGDLDKVLGEAEFCRGMTGVEKLELMARMNRGVLELFALGLKMRGAYVNDEQMMEEAVRARGLRRRSTTAG